MKRSFILQAGCIVSLLITTSHVWAGDAADFSAAAETVPLFVQAAGADGSEDDAWEEENWENEWESTDTIADPLEPLNRFFFHFNDKLYYWVLKPVARVYAGFFAEELQISIRNFYDNLLAPARAVNCLLQGRVRNSSEEVVRFALNGAGGLFYINWPFLGPSNFRDSLGMFGDAFVHPIILLDAGWEVTIGAWTLERVNYTALTLGDYELFTETALDPYAAVKDAYQQYRNGLIKE